MENEVFDTDTLRDLIRETVKEALDDLTSAVEQAASDGAASDAGSSGAPPRGAGRRRCSAPPTGCC